MYKNQKDTSLYLYAVDKAEFPITYGSTMRNIPGIQTGLNIQGINQKCFGVEVYPEALFLQIKNRYPLQNTFPAGKDYIK